MKTEKKEALAHYRKMIKYAHTQNPRHTSDKHVMMENIGEAWMSSSCSYCSLHPSLMCTGCPLNTSNASCCNGFWYKMDKAKTWKTWIKYANLTMQFIKEKG